MSIGRDWPLRCMLWLGAIVAAGALLSIALAWAQDNNPSPAPPSTERDSAAATKADEEAVTDEDSEEEKAPIHIEWADRMRREPDPEDPENEDIGFYYLTGNVHIRQKDTHLYCDECVYNAGNDTARALGNLKIVEPDTTVTGDLVEADFDEEVAVITGNVRMVTQKKGEEENGDAEAAEEAEPADDAQEAEPPEGEGDAEDDKWAEHKEKRTVVTCEKLTYWYEEDRAIATGNVVAVQEDKTVNADEGVYVGEEDKLTLKGDPVTFRRENGDKGQTTEVVIYIEEDRFETAGFTGVFKRRDKDEENGEGPAEEPSPEPESDATTTPQSGTETPVPE